VIETMNSTPNTLVYMLAGYTVIFAAILGYALSIVLRMRRLSREKKLYEQEKTNG
jgi:CcmD family protein